MDILNCIKALNKITDNVEIKKKAIEKYKSGYVIEEILGSIIKYGDVSDFNSFQSACFKKYKIDESVYINFLENPNIEESQIFQCFKCKSKKIYTFSKQTRSGDEATTVFAKCIICNNNWIINN